MPDSPIDIDAEILGLKEVAEKLDQLASEAGHGSFTLTGALQESTGKAALLVTRSARKNAPVDTGRLRASITPEVVTRDNVVRGIVGSNVSYAPHQEFGTRAFTPPISPIWRWAMRKTKGNFKRASRLFIRAMTSIRGRGIIAKRYLQRALESNSGKIFDLIGKAVGRVIEK
jgi:phage gpG-like protein